MGLRCGVPCMLLESDRGDGRLCAPQEWKLREDERQEDQRRCVREEQVGVALYPAWAELRPAGSWRASAVSSRTGKCSGGSPSAGGGKS